MADSLAKQTIAAFQTMLGGISKANGYNFDIEGNVLRKKILFDGRVPDNLGISQDLTLTVFSELQQKRIAGMNTGSSQKPSLQSGMLISIQGLTNGVYPNEGDAGLDVEDDIIECIRAQVVAGNGKLGAALGIPGLRIDPEEDIESTILYPMPGTSDLTTGAQVNIAVSFRRT
ncbi:MAG: hypothetical protein AAF512_00710 [Pseudomonadota bacterium]